MADPARLPRRIVRKIVIQPARGSWFAMVVGFDPRFFTPVVSQQFVSREAAMAEALRLGRKTGLPVITAETLTERNGPGEAA